MKTLSLLFIMTFTSFHSHSVDVNVESEIQGCSANPGMQVLSTYAFMYHDDWRHARTTLGIAGIDVAESTLPKFETAEALTAYVTEILSQHEILFVTDDSICASINTALKSVNLETDTSRITPDTYHYVIYKDTYLVFYQWNQKGSNWGTPPLVQLDKQYHVLKVIE